MSIASEPVSLVTLAAVPWNYPLIGRSRMLTEAWRAAGRTALFVEAPSIHPLKNWAVSWRDRLTGRQPPFVERPSRIGWVADWPRQEVAELNAIARRRAAALRRGLARQVDPSSAVAVVVVPTWAPWLDVLGFRHVIYDCIDDLAVHCPTPAHRPLFEHWESELLQRATAAVTTTESLRDGLRSRRPGLPTAIIRNGVDLEWFERQAARSPRPGDIPCDGRPVIGFVGALFEWVDVELIEAVAGRLPTHWFVFVGPGGDRPEFAAVRALENVRWLGARPYALVPAHIAAFDVCWIPFRRNDIVRATNPVKVYEYLALGKPVLATPFADRDLFEPAVSFAESADDVAAGLQRAAAAPGDGREHRLAYARANTWARRADQYVELVRSLA